MYESFPVGNPEIPEELMQKRRLNGTSTRLNVAANKETYIHKREGSLERTGVVGCRQRRTDL